MYLLSSDFRAIASSFCWLDYSTLLFNCPYCRKFLFKLPSISQWFWWKKHEQLEKKQHPTSTKQSETCQSSQKSVTFGVLFPMFCPLLSIHLESGVESQSCLLWGSVNPAIPNMFETTFCKGYFVDGWENVAKHQHHKKHCKYSAMNYF